MGCLLLSADWVGVLASRKIVLACERHLAVRAMVDQGRPDFCTSSDVRTRPWEAFKDVWVQVVCLAAEAGLVPWGHVSTDGTPIPGHASRHKAMSDGAMKQEGARLREALDALVPQASQQDEGAETAWGSRRGDALPAELARREDRVARSEAAMRRVEVQAKAAAEGERQHRAAAAARQRMGQPRRGNGPKPVQETPGRQGPKHLDGARAAEPADQHQGLGGLRPCARACGWGGSDPRGP